MYADIGIYQINLAAVVMPLSYMHRLGVPRDLTKLLRLRQRKNDLNRQISVMKQEDLKPRWDFGYDFGIWECRECSVYILVSDVWKNI